MLENIPVIVCNCNFHLTKSSVVFFLRLFFLHKGFNLVWITHQILGKNLASVLCNQDIILDPDSDLPLINIKTRLIGDDGAWTQLVVHAAVTSCTSMPR